MSAQWTLENVVVVFLLRSKKTKQIVYLSLQKKVQLILPIYFFQYWFLLDFFFEQRSCLALAFITRLIRIWQLKEKIEFAFFLVKMRNKKRCKINTNSRMHFKLFKLIVLLNLRITSISQLLKMKEILQNMKNQMSLCLNRISKLIILVTALLKKNHSETHFLKVVLIPALA